jgi:exodeoxyribonuclease VII small subunit
MAADEAPASYSAALAELETILTELEDDAIDVDHLSARVERAAVLIRHCRERIGRARTEVERIVADLDGTGPDDPGVGDPGAQT